MSGAVALDTNLLLLLIVGSADRRLISSHRRIRDDYTESDFELLGYLVSGFSDLIVVPQILAEVSNLSRQIGDPARTKVMDRLKRLIDGATEIMCPSAVAAQRAEFIGFGLNDAALLHVCSLTVGDSSPTLLSNDQPLVFRAMSLGYRVLNYRNI